MAPEEISQDPAPAAEVDQLAERLDAAAGDNGNSDQIQTTDAPAEFTGHPAWKPFEETLGPIHYRTIEPHLREMNRAFEAKIAAQNAKLEPWKQFESVDPGQLQASLAVVQRLESDPLTFYKQLEHYLRQNGMIEQAEQAAAAADAVAGTENDIPSDEDDDPRIAQLKAQIDQLTQGQQQFMQFQQLQAQQAEHEQAVEREYSSLGQELKALKDQGVDDATLGAVIDRAELLYYRTGKPTPLAEIYKAIADERAAILNQPRPVDRAPRLPGVTGGAPSQQVADLSTASRSQSVETFAALIAANRDN